MNKTALVTGGSRGIGLGIVKKLAGEGYNVAICATGQAEDYVALVSEIENTFNVKALYCHCDLSQIDQFPQVLDRINQKLGPINLLVNNAGVAPKHRADITACQQDSYDFVMDINLKGPFFLTQIVAKGMIAAKKAVPSFAATIINIGSISATVASISRAEYCLSKAGVGIMTQLWAVRLAQDGIAVYEIRPGIIMTDMTAVVKEKYDKLIGAGLTLQPRWGLVEDVANAAAMLARGDLAYSTGQVIKVDGGMLVERL